MPRLRFSFLDEVGFFDENKKIALKNNFENALKDLYPLTNSKIDFKQWSEERYSKIDEIYKKYYDPILTKKGSEISFTTWLRNKRYKANHQVKEIISACLIDMCQILGCSPSTIIMPSMPNTYLPDDRGINFKQEYGNNAFKYKKIFSNRMISRMKNQNLDQQQLAKKANLAESTISKLITCSEERIPKETLSKLMAVAALDCTRDYLLGNTSGPNNSNLLPSAIKQISFKDTKRIAFINYVMDNIPLDQHLLNKQEYNPYTWYKECSPKIGIIGFERNDNKDNEEWKKKRNQLKKEKLKKTLNLSDKDFDRFFNIEYAEVELSEVQLLKLCELLDLEEDEFLTNCDLKAEIKSPSYFTKTLNSIEADVFHRILKIKDDVKCFENLMNEYDKNGLTPQNTATFCNELKVLLKQLKIDTETDTKIDTKPGKKG